MEQRTDACSRTRYLYVFALGGLALVALANGGHAEHGDTSPRGYDGEEQEHWQLERKEDGR